MADMVDGPATKRAKLAPAPAPAPVPGSAPAPAPTLLDSLGLLQELAEQEAEAEAEGAPCVASEAELACTALDLCPREDEALREGVRRLLTALQSGALTPAVDKRTGVNVLGPGWYPALRVEVGAAALQMWRGGRFLLLRAEELAALEEHLLQRAVCTHLGVFAEQARSEAGSSSSSSELPPAVADALGEPPGTVPSESLALALQARWRRLQADIAAAVVHAAGAGPSSQLLQLLGGSGGSARPSVGALAFLRDGSAEEAGSAALRALHAPALKAWLAAATACGHMVDTAALLTALSKRGIKLGLEELDASLRAEEPEAFAAVCDVLLPRLAAAEHWRLRRSLLQRDSVPVLREYLARCPGTARFCEEAPTYGAVRTLQHLWTQSPALRPAPTAVPDVLAQFLSAANPDVPGSLRTLLAGFGGAGAALARATPAQREALLKGVSRVAKGAPAKNAALALLEAGCAVTRGVCEDAGGYGNLPVLEALWSRAPDAPELWEGALRSAARNGAWPALVFLAREHAAAGRPLPLPPADLAALLQTALAGGRISPLADVAAALAAALHAGLPTTP